MVSRFGGWEHNDWLRGMIWHHEYLIAYYVGLIEIRHFTFFPGPKFSIFYNVYSAYEYNQLANQWAHKIEMKQTEHLRHTKEQLEYNRIDAEYEFVKKRALINFLTNSKLREALFFDILPDIITDICFLIEFLMLNIFLLRFFAFFV